MITPFRPILILGILFMAAVRAAAAPAAADGAPASRICRITFSADGTIDSLDLERRIQLKAGDPAEPARIRQSIESLYASGDFFYVECASLEEDCGLRIDFRLILKRYFSRFLLQGPGQIKNLDTELARFFPLGEPFTEKRLLRFTAEAEKYLSDRGYPALTLSPKFQPEADGMGMRVLLPIPAGKPARFGKIVFQGESALPEKQLLRAVKIKPGKAYSREALLAAVEGLKELHVDKGYLAPRIVIHSTSPPNAANRVDVAIGIQSGSKFEVTVAGAAVSGRKLRELLPIYREADLDVDLLQEGRENLQAYLLRLGYSSADIEFGIRDQPNGVSKAVVYQVQLGQKLTVDRIDVQGLKAMERADFIALLGRGPSGIRRGRYFTLGGFDGAILRIIEEYRNRGYLDARLVRRDLTIADSGTVDLEFEVVEEGQSVVRSLEFLGNRQLPTTELAPRVSLEPNKPFSEKSLQTDQKRLQEYYLEKGFSNAQIETRWRREASNVDVTVQIAEDQRLSISRIAVVGNQRTHLRPIMKNLGFKTGDNLVIKKLFEGEQKLYNTSGFDLVRIRTTDQEMKEPGQTLIVGVRETRPRIMNFGVGYQDFEGPRGLFELSYLNVRGTLRTAQVRVRGSKINQSITLNLRETRPLNRNFESFATLQASRKEEVSFTEQRYGASLQLLREISRVNTLAFRYSYEHVDVRDAKVAISEIPRISQPINLSSFSTALFNDSRDNPFDPQRGSFSSANLQVTTPFLKSDAQFVKFFGQTQYYRNLPKKLQLAEALRLGFAKRFGGSDPLLPISERFFAGGASTLRGFANDEAGPRDPVTDQPVGGNALIINNLELRFPIVSRFGGVIFYDTGNVFSQVSDISLAAFTNSVGFGLKIQTPIGPVRFDYGFNLKPLAAQSSQHFFLSFGPLF